MEAFFLPSAGGTRFCIFHPAAGAPRGSVLFLHAFAEELNKSRRAVALGARALATHGFAVLQVDLLGCGDSSGEFGDASWEAWIDDVLLAHRWLRSRCAGADYLWGLRVGALLAAQSAVRLPSAPSLLLWQPVLSGNQYLTQFLRLRIAQGVMAGGAPSADTAALRKHLAGGGSLEVGGYLLTPALALALDGARFDLPAGYAGRIVWRELSSRDEPELLPPSQAVVANLRGNEIVCDAHALRGAAFWQSQEIEEAPALVADTCQALCLQ